MFKYNLLKRKWIIVLTFPLLLVLIAWLLPVSSNEEAVTSTAIISLGTYDNEDWNNEHRVNSMLTNPNFYQQYAPQLWQQKGMNIWHNLSVTTQNHTVHLSYTNRVKKEAISDLNRIVQAFLLADKTQFQDKTQFIQSTIQTLQEKKVSNDTMVDQQKFLYELHTTLSKLKPSTLIQAPSENVVTMHSLSKQKRIVLGFLIGCLLSVCWISINVIQLRASKDVQI